jgi:hypothetical protein
VRASSSSFIPNQYNSTTQLHLILWIANEQTTKKPDEQETSSSKHEFSCHHPTKQTAVLFVFYLLLIFTASAFALRNTSLSSSSSSSSPFPTSAKRQASPHTPKPPHLRFCARPTFTPRKHSLSSSPRLLDTFSASAILQKSPQRPISSISFYHPCLRFSSNNLPNSILLQNLLGRLVLVLLRWEAS